MSAADIRGWGRDVETFAREQPREAIDVVDDAVTQRLRRDTGGDGGFSNGRRMGRARTRVTARDGEAEVSADGSRAVWTILETGTSGHTIDAGKGRMLRTPYGPRRRVRVSGVRGQRTFTEGATDGLRDAERELERAWAQIGD